MDTIDHRWHFHVWSSRRKGGFDFRSKN